MSRVTYVAPAIVRVLEQSELVRAETFAPILYVMEYEHFDEAIGLHNDVPQGLSSCVFTMNLREAERFLSASGSDCGLAYMSFQPGVHRHLSCAMSRDPGEKSGLAPRAR